MSGKASGGSLYREHLVSPGHHTKGPDTPFAMFEHHCVDRPLRNAEGLVNQKPFDGSGYREGQGSKPVNLRPPSAFEDRAGDQAATMLE